MPRENLKNRHQEIEFGGNLASKQHQLIIPCSKMDNIKCQNNETEVEWVGSGSFGMVVRVVERSEGRNQFIVKKKLFYKIRNKKACLEECITLQNLHNKNVVPILEVDFLSDGIPVITSGWMPHSLTSLLSKYENIAHDKKMSIIYDINSGICFLHNSCDPPIVHHNLHSNNIFLTENYLVAKIGDFLPKQATLNTKLRGGFLPRGSTDHITLASNVFSFGVIILHIINQQCPIPQESNDGEGQRYSNYISCTKDESLKKIIISCLNDDPQKRPQISYIDEDLKAIIENDCKDSEVMVKIPTDVTDEQNHSFPVENDDSEEDEDTLQTLTDKKETAVYDTAKFSIGENVSSSHTKRALPGKDDPLNSEKATESHYKITTTPKEEASNGKTNTAVSRKAADLLDDSAIVSDLSTGSSPGEFDTISSKKPRAKPKRDDGTGIAYDKGYMDISRSACYIENRGSGFFGKLRLDGNEIVCLFTAYHVVIKELKKLHVELENIKTVTKKTEISIIEEDIKKCDIFIKGCSSRESKIPLSEILIKDSIIVSTRTELDFCMMKIDKDKLSKYDVLPANLEDNTSIKTGDQIHILQYAKSQILHEHSQRELARSTSPCAVEGCLILYLSETEKGSSGGPILKENGNKDYSIVGLHRGYRVTNGTANYGSTIIDILRKIKDPSSDVTVPLDADVQKAIQTLK